MGKGGTRFVGDAVAVRAKAKGYTSKDMKKVRRRGAVVGCCRQREFGPPKRLNMLGRGGPRAWRRAASAAGRVGSPLPPVRRRHRRLLTPPAPAPPQPFF